jgi:hypothetical protein
MNTTKKIGWFGVLAGAYRGRQMERRMVAHAAAASEDGGNAFAGRALCGYDSERLSDMAAEESEERCPKCLARAEKLAAKAAK